MSNRDNNIYVTAFLHIGDRVEMRMDPEARGWGRKGVPDGTQGTVVGFYRYTDYFPRVHGFGRTPGVYTRNGAAVIAWDDGSSAHEGGMDICWVGNVNKKERFDDSVYREAFEKPAYVGPLPELPFWEGDLVEVVSERGSVWDDTNRVRIERINYHHLNEKCNDGVTEYPIWNVGHPEGNHGTTAYNTQSLKLVERGDFWKWFNGKRDEIKFKTLEDEIAFHFALGKVKEIRRPGGNYHWPKDAVLAGAEAGLIDVLKGSGFFNTTSIFGYKLEDVDLGNRARAKLIKGFRP